MVVGENPHRNLLPDDGLHMGGEKSGWVVPGGRINSKAFRSAVEASAPLWRRKRGLRKEFGAFVLVSE